MAGKRKSAHLVAFFAGKKHAKFEKTLVRALFLAFSVLGKGPVACEVHCISDRESAALNRKFRGKKEGPATVLSFPADPAFPRPDIPKKARFLGEIYLAPDMIARKGEWPLPRYAVHGALHLLGYTHEAQSDRIEMESLEGAIAALFAREKVL